MLTRLVCVPRVERSSAFVQRRIRLPDSANLSKITAKLENGVLRLDIPKVEVSIPAPGSIAGSCIACNTIWQHCIAYP